MSTPTNLSTLIKVLAVTLGLWLLQPVSAVAGTIKHLVIPPNPVSGNTFTLPGYGTVRVTHNYPTAADFTLFHQTAAENQSAGSFSWGTDTDRFNILNTQRTSQTYTLTFSFQNGPPDVSRLLLIVVGLAANSTATVSAPGSLAGEFHFPPPLPGGSSTTLINGMILSSKQDGDAVNTGWALYQPTGTFTNLSVTMKQQSGDGVGWTLAYAENPKDCCDKMVVSPFPNDQLTQKYKTFEIYNLKSPSSPICYIDIAMNPIPFTGGWQGGDLYENSGSGLVFIPPATQFIFPYKRIPQTGNIAAVSNNASTPAVKFNIGIDFSHPYNGTVTLAVHHCDGSICTLTYGPWIEGLPPPGDPWWRVDVGNTQSDLIPVVLTYVGGQMPDKSARWMAVQLQNTEAEIFAIESPELGENQITTARSTNPKAKLRLKSSSNSAKFALLEFSTPLVLGVTDYVGTTLTLIIKKRPGTSFSPNLLLTLYDENSNVIISGPPQR